MTPAARILALAEFSLRDPRQATRALLAEKVPPAARILGLLLVAIASALIASIGIGSPLDGEPPIIALMTASPFRLALFEAGMLGLTVLLVHQVGRVFGGRGSLADSLLITVWINFLMLGPELVQSLLALVSIDLAGIVGMFSLGLFLWLTTSFIAELHGFRSRPLVFLATLAASFAAGAVIVSAVILVFGPEVLLPHV